MTLLAPAQAFLGAPVQTDLRALQADAAILGIPHGVPYDMAGVASDTANAPAVVRARSARFVPFVAHHDFDLGGEMLARRPFRLVDCGDVEAEPRDVDGNARCAIAVVRAMLECGVIPLVLGGDDSVPVFVLRAFEGHAPLHVVQIDAHLDFRDEVDGIRDGYSSTMRRATELPWVRRVVHVGVRGVGTARTGDVEDTLAAGNAIVTAREVREAGIGAVLRHLPEAAPLFVTLDCDGLDPAVMPGTSAPLPGGLSFDDVAALLRAMAARGCVVGMDVVEHYPRLDVNGLTAVAIVRLLVNLIGGLARAADVATTRSQVRGSAPGQ